MTARPLLVHLVSRGLESGHEEWRVLRVLAIGLATCVDGIMQRGVEELLLG